MLDTLAPDLLATIVAYFDTELTRLFAQVCSAFRIPVDMNKRCIPISETERCQDGCGLAYPVHELKDEDHVTWTKAWVLETGVVVRIWTKEWGSKKVVSRPIDVLFNLMDAQYCSCELYANAFKFVDVDLVFQRLSKKGKRLTYTPVPGKGWVRLLFNDKMINVGIKIDNLPTNVDNFLNDRFYNRNLAKALDRTHSPGVELTWLAGSVWERVLAECRPIASAGFM